MSADASFSAMPRSALRYRPIHANTARRSEEPSVRRASKSQHQTRKPPVQQPEPAPVIVTQEPHWLFFIGLGMMIAFTFLSAGAIYR